MSTRNALALALATLALPCAAGAATQGTIPVDPNGGVSGSFAAPGTQTWTLELEQGRDYAVSGRGDCTDPVAIRAAGGRVLASFWSQIDGSAGPAGASFRAPYTGSYTVEVTAGADDFAPPDDCGSGSGDRYGLSAARDCAGDATTRCAIGIGRTLQGLRLDYDTDSDWFRTTLAAGRAYRATATETNVDCFDLAVLDARGRLVAGALYTCAPDGRSLTFTAPASGAFFLAVSADYSPDPYSLSLARVR